MKKKALVIVPGFREVSTSAHYVDITRKARDEGIETFVVDWPYWQIDMNQYTMTQTLAAVVRKVDSLGANDYEIVLVGESVGGIIAANVASRKKLKGLILAVTPYQYMKGDDAEADALAWKEKGYREYISKTTGRITKVPYSFVEDSEKYNSLVYAPIITMPVSFIVGLADTKVPNKLSRQIYDLVTTEKQWLEFEGMEHTYKYQPEIMEKVDAKIVSIAESYFSS